MTIEEILEIIPAPGAQPSELLRSYQQDRYLDLWRTDSRLYNAFARGLIRSGDAAQAFELAQEGLEAHENDLALRYVGALALARGGNRSLSESWVQSLLEDPNIESAVRSDALSLAGRLQKDACMEAKDEKVRCAAAARSAELYGQAYEESGHDTFPGINLATMLLVAGETARAIQVAQEVRVGVTEEGDFWAEATLGEAALVLSDPATAHAHYRRAFDLSAGRLGDQAAMRRNFRLLSQVVEPGDELTALFGRGTVIAFSGHMLDHPDRKEAPRFPASPELESWVSTSIDTALAELNAVVCCTSAACGSDIIFAECVLKLGAELHIVLPCARDDFFHMSVDFGYEEFSSWRERCEAVLAKATRVHHVTREAYLGDDVLFDVANQYLQGMAVSKAQDLELSVRALTVSDASAASRQGGTRDFSSSWLGAGHEETVIDLAALRSGLSGVKAQSYGAASPPPSTCVGPDDARREFMAMLFADVKNFSKLSEAQSRAFFAGFLGEVARVIECSATPPVFCNTWGDGLFIVFDDVTGAAEFSMALLEGIEAMDFASYGLPADTTLRIGLHAGPVYPCENLVVQRRDFFGSHVNRAARIEPVTIPGCAFTSEQFASILALRPGHNFKCQPVGAMDLAKGYDRVPLFRLSRGN